MSRRLLSLNEWQLVVCRQRPTQTIVTTAHQPLFNPDIHTDYCPLPTYPHNTNPTLPPLTRPTTDPSQPTKRGCRIWTHRATPVRKERCYEKVKESRSARHLHTHQFNRLRILSSISYPYLPTDRGEIRRELAGEGQTDARFVKCVNFQLLPV